uniref:Uncharacterized protein n=1 Tax=Heterorhabditis bacteriophora TaxID=37862 RepID=A0A1I7WK41_HETBA
MVVGATGNPGTDAAYCPCPPRNRYFSKV